VTTRHTLHVQRMLIENPLNSSELAFPILECIHIVGFIIGIGSAALVDLRLLGVGLRRQSPAQLARDTDLWTLAGLTIAIFAGMLLYSTDPDKYYLNQPFVVKATCLVLAIVFHYTIHRKTVLSESWRAKRPLVAFVSLSLWMSVVAGGMVVSFTVV
jgi:hypothetical protein